MFPQITNTNLTEENIPSPEAPWFEIAEFALAFDGYDVWGSFDRCAVIGNEAAKVYHKDGTLPGSLTELRTCLFFEQRRYHHFGESPIGGEMDYIGALLGAIAQKVRDGDSD